MKTEIAILRSLLRLSQRPLAVASPTSLTELVARVERDGVDASDVPRALAALARADLVLRSPQGLRLSLSGLAFVVATGGVPRRARKASVSRRASIVARPRIAPLTRRKNAA